MPKRTNPFQKLSSSIMAVFYEPDYSVEESILERNPRTGTIREIDILITERKNPQNRIMIECRDHQRPQDVVWIDGLAGKSKSLGFSKVVAISSSGFTNTAITEAKDRGIELLALVKAEERDWRKWLFALNEIQINLINIELVDVSFGIDSEWTGNLNMEVKLFNVFLVDKRNTERIPLKKWVDEIPNDPEQQKYMDITSKHGKINPIVFTHRCSPDMGFNLDGDNTFIPLVELKVFFNYKVEETKVPLNHMTIGKERILVGDTSIKNTPTKIVIHESTNRIITIMLEQKISPK
jgi:hypothetical protein